MSTVVDSRFCLPWRETVYALDVINSHVKTIQSITLYNIRSQREASAIEMGFGKPDHYSACNAATVAHAACANSQRQRPILPASE